jgi:hypothetical protein
VFGFFSGAIYREPGSYLKERTLRVIAYHPVNWEGQLTCSKSAHQDCVFVDPDARVLNRQVGAACSCGSSICVMALIAMYRYMPLVGG